MKYKTKRTPPDHILRTPSLVLMSRQSLSHTPPPSYSSSPFPPLYPRTLSAISPAYSFGVRTHKKLLFLEEGNITVNRTSYINPYERRNKNKKKRWLLEEWTCCTGTSVKNTTMHARRHTKIKKRPKFQVPKIFAGPTTTHSLRTHRDPRKNYRRNTQSSGEQGLQIYSPPPIWSSHPRGEKYSINNIYREIRRQHVSWT